MVTLANIIPRCADSVKARRKIGKKLKVKQKSEVAGQMSDYLILDTGQDRCTTSAMLGREFLKMTTAVIDTKGDPLTLKGRRKGVQLYLKRHPPDLEPRRVVAVSDPG